MKVTATLVAILGLFVGCKGTSTNLIQETKPKLVELLITKIEAETSNTKTTKHRVENFSGHVTCSGAFVTSNGDILTARHCTENSGVIDVLTSEGEEYRATVVATSTVHDLALLHIDKCDTPYFRLAKSAYQGETVFVLGNPLGIIGSLSTGIIAKLNGDVTYIDCGVLPGNSGGPVFNDQGDLVGIATAGFVVLYGTTHLNIIQSIGAIYGFALNGR